MDDAAWAMWQQTLAPRDDDDGGFNLSWAEEEEDEINNGGVVEQNSETTTPLPILNFISFPSFFFFSTIF